MDAGTYNVNKATCIMRCRTCQGAVDFWVQTVPFGIAVSGQTQLNSIVQYDSGAQSDLTSTSSWSSSATSIATVSSGLVQGLSPGGVNIAATSPRQTIPGTDCEPYTPPPCPQTPMQSGGGGTVSQFGVGYSDYIPVDHVNGPTSCYYQGISYDKLYMGDANRNTYRATEFIVIQPDTQQSSGFFPGIGQSRNYGAGSPANGSTLSAADEDGIPNDCHLWNAAGTASTTGMYWDTSFPYAHQGQVHFDGSASNPLESSSAAIQWDMRTVIDTTNPLAPTAIVNYNHTCYPSHQIKVNGKVVYLYTPPSNDLAYISACLVFNGNNKIIGQQTTPTQVPPY